MKNMKTRIVIIYCAFCLVAFFAGVFAGSNVKTDKEPEIISAQETSEQMVYEESTPSPEPTPQASPLPAEGRYMLNLAGDSIAVYRLNDGGETELLYKKDDRLTALRQDDYESLCTGIFTNSENEAREMVEDFIS